MKHVVLIGFLLSLTFLPAAAETRLDETITRNPRTRSAARAGWQETPLDELLGAAMIAATRADVALVGSVAPKTRFEAGPLTARQVLTLAPEDERLVVATMSGASIRALLERAADRFGAYDFERAPSRPDTAIDQFQGLSYELDLTQPAGARVLHLAWRGEPLAADSVLRVAVSQRRVDRGDPELASARPGASPVSLHGALVAHLQGMKEWAPDFERSWSVLPDYAGSEERPLIDRLVRERALPREEALRLFPDEPARRADIAYWLARAFGWRQERLSGAFPDVPDSLEVWLDGLVRHKVLDHATRTSEFFLPFTAVTLDVALEWCGNAMRTIVREDAGGTRARLLAGVGVSPDSTSTKAALTRGQALAIVANARFAGKNGP